MRGLSLARKPFSKVGLLVIAIAALVAQPLSVLIFTSAVDAVGSETVEISNVAELRTAVENQADGQTWNIQPNVYGISRFDDITVGGETGWYLPITANNLTINGVGNPILYGTGYTANGNWSTQNFISVFGDNVTINGVTLMPKVEPNKTIEVLGSNFTLRNTIITPNTLTNQSEYDSTGWAQEAKQWGGSLYFSHAGNHTVQNVTIYNAGISFRYSPSGTHISFDNVQIVDTTAVAWINNYRYSSGFNNSGNSIIGVPKVAYHVTNGLDNFQMALDSARSGDLIELDSDITAAKELNLVNDGVTINGNGHTIGAGFNKTGNDNNSILGIKSDNVIVNNLKVDAGSASNNLHGINIYQASGVVLNSVTAINGNTGVVVNGSTVTIDGINTSGNRWHGVNVDKNGAELTIKGANSHSEAYNLFVDDRSVGKINDLDHKYMITAVGAGDVYVLDTSKPTIVLNSPVDGSYNPSSYQLTANDNNKLSVVTGNLYSGSTLIKSCSASNANQPVYTLNCAVSNSLADGVYTIRYNAKDVAGNMSTTSTSTFVVDKTAPNVPTETLMDSNGASVANGGYIKTKSFTFTLPSGVARYQLKYWNDIQGSSFNGEAKAWKPNNISGYMPTSTTYKDSFTQGEGKHYFAFSACDAAGNCSAYSAPFVVVYDKTAPNVSIVSPEDGAIVNGGPLQKWTTTTPTDVDHYIYESYTANSTSSTQIHTQALTGTQRNVGGLQNIMFWWRVGAVDKAGNTAWTELRKMTIDNDAPGAPVTTSAKPYYTKLGTPTKTLTWAAGANSSDVAYYEYAEYYNTAPTSETTPTNWLKTPIYGTSTTDTAWGSNITIYWRVRAVDQAGNKSAWSDIGKIITDVDAPTVTVNAVASSEDTTPTVTGTTSEFGGDVTITIDGSDVATVTSDASGNWSWTATAPFAVGLHTVLATATDAAGNTSSSDVTAPQSYWKQFTIEAPAVVQVATTTTTTPAPQAAPTAATPTNDGTAVLGAQDGTTTTDTNEQATVGSKDDDSSQVSAAGASDTKSANNGEWNILGLAWYWWLVIIAAIIALWWFIAAWRRRKDEEA